MTRGSRQPRRRAAARVREHPAPPGALRPPFAFCPTIDLEARSGSTQHHQVRSRLCSIGAGRGPRPKCQGVEVGRCCGGASRGRAVSTHPVPFCCEVRTQGRNQPVVRGVVLRNSVPCVRNRDLRAKEEPPSRSGASDQGSETLGPGPASTNYVPEERLALLRFRGAGALWRPRLDAALGGRGCLSH